MALLTLNADGTGSYKLVSPVIMMGGNANGKQVQFYTNNYIVTVNTDNMMVSNTTEARELALVADTFNMEKKDVKQLIMNGVEAAFTTEGIKNRLRARVETQFAKVAGIRG